MIDSDEEIDFPIIDERDECVYENLIRKSYSIRGMRKLNNDYKIQRRFLLDDKRELSNDYIFLSQSYLKRISELA